MLNMRRSCLAIASCLAFVLFLCASPALAQTYRDVNGTPVQAVVPLACPTGGGTCTGTGSSGGGAVTAAAGSYAAGFSPDIGNCATATAWTGTGTPSLCALELGIYASVNNPLAAQSSAVWVGNVGQNGTWTVGQSGSWTVGQSGSWTVTNTPAAAATGGALNYLHYSAATSGGDSQFIKASAGTVYSITVTQSTTTAMELKLYNSTSAPTCSSATGIIDNIPIPSNATSPGYHLTFPVGRAFSTGISYCITAFGNPASSTDSGTPATGVTLSVTYD